MAYKFIILPMVAGNDLDLTIRKMTDQLPAGLVQSFSINERFQKLLKYGRMGAEMTGVDFPSNYIILLVAFIILSYLLTFILGSIMPGKKQVLYTGSEQFSKFVYNQADSGNMAKILAEVNNLTLQVKGM